jgi:hypothetical protein
LGECELVTQCPVHLQRKVLKLVANKLALAIRADVVNVESSRKRTRDTGINLRREIEDKIEKLEEPDKAPTIKALPKYVVKIVLDCQMYRPAAHLENLLFILFVAQTGYGNEKTKRRKENTSPEGKI